MTKFRDTEKIPPVLKIIGITKHNNRLLMLTLLYQSYNYPHFSIEIIYNQNTSYGNLLVTILYELKYENKSTIVWEIPDLKLINNNQQHLYSKHSHTKFQ